MILCKDDNSQVLVLDFFSPEVRKRFFSSKDLVLLSFYASNIRNIVFGSSNVCFNHLVLTISSGI